VSRELQERPPIGPTAQSSPPIKFSSHILRPSFLAPPVTIPDSFTAIGQGAFAYQSDITRVVIPDSVVTIGVGAFSFCRSLITIIIPDSVVTIESKAFYFCRSLITIIIPDSVVTIGTFAFYFCYSLMTIAIPDSVMTIGAYAFSYCRVLTDVIFKTGSQLLSIGGSAFYGSKLSTVNIPADVDFGGSVFDSTPCEDKSIFQAGNTIINCALVSLSHSVSRRNFSRVPYSTLEAFFCHSFTGDIFRTPFIYLL